MKYIEAERVKAEIDKIVNGLKSNCDPNPLGTTEECMAAAEIEALELVKTTIDKMKQAELDSKHQEKSYREMADELKKAVEFGQRLRKLVIDMTGYDPHDIVGQIKPKED